MKENKNISFVQGIWMKLALVLALIILSMMTGLSFWVSIMVGIFWGLLSIGSTRSAYRTLSKIMKVIFVLVLLGIVVKSFLPQTFNSKVKNLVALDQAIISVFKTDTKVKAEGLFNKQREKASKQFLLYYDQLLEEAKIEEARDTLAAFEKKWQFRVKEIRAREEEVILPPLSQVAERRNIPDSTFNIGVYQIDVKGQTPFYIYIPSSLGCITYSLSSLRYNYQIVFSDGEVVQDGPGVILRHRLEPKFILKGDDLVTLRIKRK